MQKNKENELLNLYKIYRKYGELSYEKWINYSQENHTEFLDLWNDPYQPRKGKKPNFNEWLKNKTIYEFRKNNFSNYWLKLKPSSDEIISLEEGIYIVSLKNKEFISVNNHDIRRKDKSIKVNYLNCKIGESKKLQKRKEDYFLTFGETNVEFEIIAFVNNAKTLEKSILNELKSFQIISKFGKRNEWLKGITPKEVKEIATDHLYWSNLKFELPF